MRKFMMAGLGTLLLLSACTTPQQRAAAKQAEMSEMMVVYGPACSRLGYGVNSDQWRECVLKLSTKDELERLGHPSYSVGFGYGRWGLGGRWNP